jgi:hypothetical protein
MGFLSISAAWMLSFMARRFGTKALAVRAARAHSIAQ